MKEVTRSTTKSRSRSRSLSPYDSRSKSSSKREKRSKHKSKSNDSDKDRSRSDSKVRSKKRKHKDHDRRSREQSESRSRSRSRDRIKSRSRRRSRSVSKKRKERSRSRNDDRDKSKSHKKSHSDRDRDRDQDRHRDRSRRSGSRSRKYSFDEMCDSYQNNSNYDGMTGSYGYGSGSGSGMNRNDQPSRTLMLSNIPSSITQKDIYDEIKSCKINPRDIRLIKRKDSNESRGFAFIDFESIEDATEFIDMKNGVLMLGEHSKSYLQYSVSKTTVAAAAAAEQRTTKMLSSDWFCINCNEYNFKRRDYCFQCGTSRLDSELGDDGCNEISQYPTRTVMLRNLDVLTVEETIANELKQLLVDKFTLITNIVLSKDPLTSTSRGICYLQMKNVFESVSIFNVLLVTPFYIDGKSISVTYGTFDCGLISEPVENFINFGTISDSCIYTAIDLNYLAECSALKYAKTSAEFDHYFEYYKKFFADKISLGEMNNVSKQAAAAAAAAEAESESSTSQILNVPDQKDIPTGSDNRKYTKPDINQFQYDESTGYHYDSKTGLYFDSTKNLYYNGFLQRYMYWDDGNNTYVYIPNHENDTKAKKGDRKSKNSGVDMGDKVKVAKKITKDLEKWAKSLNQKKEHFNKSLMAPVVPLNESQSHRNSKQDFEIMSQTNSTQLTDSIDNIEMGIDWNKLVCLICQRQFNSKELLNKHQLLSELHKTNLQNYLKRNESSEDLLTRNDDQTSMTTPKYRDRAKERRLKFGESEPPPESKYLSRLQETAEPLSNNLGSKLLQKMGWSEGQGLGKSNQGRTSIVEADGRLNSAGLGSKFSISTSQGESYVESAKKVMYARYSNCKESD